MSEWKEYSLGEICSFVKDKISMRDVGTDVYISTENMLPDKGGITRASSIPMDGMVTRYYPETVLISNIRPYFKKIWFADKEGGCSNDVLCFKGNDVLINSKYLYYLLAQDIFFDYVMLGSKGSKMPRGDKDHIMKWKVSIPPVGEQKRIAGVLSSLDDKIDLLHRENATLEALAETLFRHYFIEDPNPEWKEAKLGDVAKIGIGRTPPRKETKWFSTSSIDVKWISIKDMGETGVYIFNTAEYLTREAVDCFKIPIIPNNTVVLSFKMTVGRIGITSEAMLSNEAIAHFILDDNSPVSKEYLYIFLKLFKFETLGSTSSIVTSINSAMIKEMELIIPDKDTMRSFDKQVCPLFEKIKTNQQQIISLSSQRDTLLPYLMYENMVK